MQIKVNGKPQEVADGATLAELLVRLELRPEQVAVERNLGIVPKSEYARCVMQPGDGLEIVTLVGGGAPAEDQLDEPLCIGRHSLRSRLMVGTGKYASFEQMADCLAASGTECVTVAVRRVDLSKCGEKTLLDFIDRKRYTILPNTAGCYTAEDALRTARLAREVLEREAKALSIRWPVRLRWRIPIGIEAESAVWRLPPVAEDIARRGHSRVATGAADAGGDDLVHAGIHQREERAAQGPGNMLEESESAPEVRGLVDAAVDARLQVYGQ